MGVPTNFPDGVTSYGIPCVGSIPTFSGNYYFVDTVNGSDGNDGSRDNPLQTLDYAYSKTVNWNGDCVLLMPSAASDASASATTGSFRLSSQLAWTKSNTHLIGLTAPGINQRARITTATGATTNIANLVSVSGQGCMFYNFSLFQGVGQAATAEQLWQDSGQRNYYGKVFFGGMGSANGAAQAGSYTFKLSGAEELTFEDCYFGADTQSRDAANANILFAANSGATCKRNQFLNCTIAAYCTDTDPTFVSAGASTLDRYNLFKNCTFINSGTSSLAAAVTGNASQGGKIILDNCSYVGVTEIGSLSNSALIQVTGAVPNGNTSGVAVNANPS